MNPRTTPPDWTAHDTQHVWHPYTQMKTAPTPTPIVRAEGAHLHTADGRRLLDGIASWWVTLHGHGHPRIAEAIGRQARELDQVIFAGYTHEPASRLAGELARLLPRGLDRVFYSDNGSTAVEVALKMALQHFANRGDTSRSNFIALENAYHGDTIGAMAASGVDVFHSTFRPLLFDVVRAEGPHGANADRSQSLEERTERCLESLERLLEEHGERTAALIIEPLIQGAGGMLMWPTSSLARMRQLCDRHGVLLIADEVFTGFGRTGKLFACEHGPIRPDIICLSKALTSGTLPLAATVTHTGVYESFLSEDRRKTFFHGHSFTGNPIACAAALESLAILQETGLERIGRIEEIHRERLERLSSHSRVSEARCLGLVSRMEVAGSPVAGDATGYLDAVGPKLAAGLLERDILLRPLGNILYIIPPLAMTDEELHRIYDAIEEVLEGL